MDEQMILDWLKDHLYEKRYKHTLGVAKAIVPIAEGLGIDVKKARVAALLHDCAKGYSIEEQYALCEKYSIALDEVSRREAAVIHGFLGEYIAEHTFGVTDREILDAIYYHTIARRDMADLDKALYLADTIEENRTIEGVEKIREIVASGDIDKAVLAALDSSICHVIRKGRLVHPNSIEARNKIILILEDKK